MKKKKCSICSEIKDIKLFYRSVTNSTGFRSECKACYNNKRKFYYALNAEKLKERTRLWRFNNKNKMIEQNKKKAQKDKCRRKKDIQFRLKCNLRARITKLVKGQYKTGSAIQDLGCSMEFFKQYLESKFQHGMTWDNYGNKSGQWSIDHIIPFCKVDLTDRDQFLKVCHYTNLQPLWHYGPDGNLAKGGR